MFSDYWMKFHRVFKNYLSNIYKTWISESKSSVIMSSITHKKLFFKLKTFSIEPIFTWSVERSSSSPSLTILGTTFLHQSISLYYACLLLAQPRWLLWFLNFEPSKKTSKLRSYVIDDKISCKWKSIHSIWLFLFQINTSLKR